MTLDTNITNTNMMMVKPGGEMTTNPEMKISGRIWQTMNKMNPQQKTPPGAMVGSPKGVKESTAKNIECWKMQEAPSQMQGTQISQYWGSKINKISQTMTQTT